MKYYELNYDREDPKCWGFLDKILHPFEYSYIKDRWISRKACFADELAENDKKKYTCEGCRNYSEYRKVCMSMPEKKMAIFNPLDGTDVPVKWNSCTLYNPKDECKSCVHWIEVKDFYTRCDEIYSCVSDAYCELGIKRERDCEERPNTEGSDLDRIVRPTITVYKDHPCDTWEPYPDDEKTAQSEYYKKRKENKEVNE